MKTTKQIAVNGNDNMTTKTSKLTTVIGLLALALGAVCGQAQAPMQVIVSQKPATRAEIAAQIRNVRDAVNDVEREEWKAEQARRAEMARQYRAAQQEAAARTAARMAAQSQAHAAWVKQQREEHDITYAAARQAYHAERDALREHQRTNTFEVRMAAYWASLGKSAEAAKLP
jgi:hypothetical protein